VQLAHDVGFTLARSAGTGPAEFFNGDKTLDGIIPFDREFVADQLNINCVHQETNIRPVICAYGWMSLARKKWLGGIATAGPLTTAVPALNANTGWFPATSHGVQFTKSALVSITTPTFGTCG